MPQSAAPEGTKQVRPYDFHRDEAMDRSRLRRLNPVLEVAAHRVTQALTGIVRAAVRVEIDELEQKRWEAFANTLPEPTFIATAAVTPVAGRIALHVPLELTSSVVELRLGGSLSEVTPERPLSEIELRLFMEVAESIVSEVIESFRSVVPMAVGPLSASSSALLVQMPNPTEIRLLINMKVSIEDAPESTVVMCFPLAVLLVILDALERVDTFQLAGVDSVVGQVRERLLEAPLELTVSLADIVLSADEVLSLSIGDVLPLQRAEGLPLHLNVGGQYYCDVVPTTQGKRLACMVVESTNQEMK